jgi:ABC-type glycerol-3-phosphate transport system permease component
MRVLTSAFVNAVTLVVVLPFALPLLWLLLAAFRPPAELLSAPPTFWPERLTLANFAESWQLLDFGRFLRNSALVAALTVVGAVLSSSLVGYAFAVIPARAKGVWFALLLSTVMLPSAVTLLPTYLLFSKLGWIGTYLPLVVPHFFANAFYVFLFRQFFRAMPRELLDAAELDGCNPWMAFWTVALPFARPAIVTVALFAGIGSYNQFLEPLVYLTRESTFTMPLGLAFFQGLHGTQLQYLIPMALVALAPVAVVFFAAQRVIQSGIVTTGGRA